MNRQSQIVTLRFLSAAGVIAAAAYAWIAVGSLLLGAPLFFVAVAIAAAAYGAALYFVPRTAPTRAVRVAVVLLTVAMRAAPAAVPAGGGSDMLRYLWDARAQRAGISPYVAVPSKPEFAHLHVPATWTMNNVNITSPYPPGAQLLFRAMTALHESTMAIKISLVLCDLAIAAVLARWLTSAGRNPLIAIAYAWNPLVVLEVAHSGHLDAAGALAVVIAAYALTRGRMAVSVIALAAGVAIKFLPLVLIPLYWKRVRLAHAALGIAIVGALYLLFMDFSRGTVPVGSVTNMVRGFRFNGPVFKAIAVAGGPWVAAGAGVAAGLLCALLIRRSRFSNDPAAWAWPMAAALICSPVLYPWYLLWVAPFFISALTAPLIVWSILILPVYIVWYTLMVSGPWAVPLWLGVIEYGGLLAAMVWTARAVRAREFRDFESGSTPRPPTAVRH